MGISFDKIQSRTATGDGLRREKLEDFLQRVDGELNFIGSQFTTLDAFLKLPPIANDPEQVESSFAATLAIFTELERQGHMETIFDRAVELRRQLEAHEREPARRRTRKGVSAEHRSFNERLKKIRDRLTFLIDNYPAMKATLEKHSGGRSGGNVKLFWGD